MAFSESSKPEAVRILEQMVTDMEEEVRLERQAVAKHMQEQLRKTPHPVKTTPDDAANEKVTDYETVK